MTIDSTLVAEEVRFLLGGLSTTVMSEEILDKLIQRNILEYGGEDDNFCIVTYQSLLDTLQYLLNAEAAGVATGTGGGILLEREETLGKRKIRVKYSDNTTGSATGWQSIYDKYIKDPSLVCKSLITSGTPVVIIGGTSQKQYDTVSNNPDSKNGWSVSSICGGDKRGRNGGW